MEHCNAVVTLAEPRLQLYKNEDEKDIDPTQYRRLIGSLHYLCNMRTYLEFSVDIVSRLMGRPKVSHLAELKRILRYVKGCIGCVIIFRTTDTGRKCNFLGFIDSNWCEDKDDQNSTGGFIFMFGGRLIS